jgi:hypothetical protein
MTFAAAGTDKPVPQARTDIVKTVAVKPGCAMTKLQMIDARHHTQRTRGPRSNFHSIGSAKQGIIALHQDSICGD